MRRTQLAGLNCMFCGNRIAGDLDAEFCAGCGGPRHHGCRGPELTAGSDSRCGNCGAEKSQADAALTRPERDETSTRSDFQFGQLGTLVSDQAFGIPFAFDQYGTIRGQARKSVRCEACGLEYVYLVERTGRGKGRNLFFLDNEGAKQQAKARASEDLEAALDRACEVVPCPGCGNIQAHMIPRARMLRRRWALKTGSVLLAIGGFLCLPAAIATQFYQHGADPKIMILLWLLCGAGLIGGVGLIVWKYFSGRRYDPNREDVELRKRMGQSRVVAHAEFEKGRSLGAKH